MKVYLTDEVPELGKDNRYTSIETIDKQWGDSILSTAPQGSAESNGQRISYVGLESGLNLQFHSSSSNDYVTVSLKDNEYNEIPGSPVHYISNQTYDDLSRNINLITYRYHPIFFLPQME
ncbi:hypothetical protein ACRBF7_003354 [Providencia stuartii]